MCSDQQYQDLEAQFAVLQSERGAFPRQVQGIHREEETLKMTQNHNDDLACQDKEHKNRLKNYLAARELQKQK